MPRPKSLPPEVKAEGKAVLEKLLEAYALLVPFSNHPIVTMLEKVKAGNFNFNEFEANILAVLKGSIERSSPALMVRKVDWTQLNNASVLGIQE